MKNIYEVAGLVEDHIRKNLISENDVQRTGVIGYDVGRFLEFESKTQAINNGSSGFLFTWIFRNGNVALKPLNQ